MGRDRAEDGEAGKVGPRVGPYEDHARRHERQPEREAQAYLSECENIIVIDI